MYGAGGKEGSPQAPPNILMNFWPAADGKSFSYIGKYTEFNGLEALIIPRFYLPQEKNFQEGLF